jgi:hypothetical protein
VSATFLIILFTSPFIVALGAIEIVTWLDDRKFKKWCDKGRRWKP